MRARRPDRRQMGLARPFRPDQTQPRRRPARPALDQAIGVLVRGTDEKILDAGPLTVEALVKAMAVSRTLIWNGPLGVFEVPPFDAATVKAAQAAAQLAKSGALTAVAGGGDTVAALAHAGVKDQFSYVSTAGGAFLEWMEGKPLPGVEALKG